MACRSSRSLLAALHFCASPTKTRHDMRRIVHHRQAGRPQRVLDELGHLLMAVALDVGALEVPHRRRGAGGDARAAGSR